MADGSPTVRLCGVVSLTSIGILRLRWGSKVRKVSEGAAKASAWRTYQARRCRETWRRCSEVSR